MAQIYGIDVSHHQGKIDWKRTAAELSRVNSGGSPGFAILRAGYSARSGRGGLIRDGQIVRNIAGCEAHKVPMGIYFYCYDTSPEAAEKTAQDVVRLLGGHRFGYPIYYDVEYEPYNLACGKAGNTAMIRAALSVLEKAGYYAAVYCSRDFFINHTNLSELAGFDKWEAAYTKADTNAVQNGCWQFSSSNTLGIAGFGSSLDCDISYIDYPAIMAAKGLNGYGTPATPPKKSVEQLAQEVLAGKWGNGVTRSTELTAAGYDYAEVQAAVNAALAAQAKDDAGGGQNCAPLDEIARAVIRGEWGNGANRRNRLYSAGYNYDEVQQRVNEILNS